MKASLAVLLTTLSFLATFPAGADGPTDRPSATRIAVEPFALASSAPDADLATADAITRSLEQFRSQFSEVAGLYSADDFRTPGARKFLDRVRFDSSETQVKLANFRKKLDAIQKKMRNVLSLQAVRVSDGQFPRIYALAQQAARRLELSQNFNIFILRSPVFNAFTYSYDTSDYDVVIHSAAAESLSDDAMLALLGHEMGHVKDQAILNQLVLAADFERRSVDTPSATHLPFYDRIFDELPSSLRAQMARVALELSSAGVSAFENEAQAAEFGRNCELTADRAAVIVTGDSKAPLKLLSTLAYGSKALSAEFNQDELIKQIRAVLANTDSPDDVSALVAEQETHPFNVLRLIEVLDFAGTKAFKDIKARLDEDSFAQENDLFLRLIVKAAETSKAYKKYLDEKADSDETLVRLKTTDQFTTQLRRLGQAFGTLGSSILSQLGASNLVAKDNALFETFIAKIKADRYDAIKSALGPAVIELLKKQIEAAQPGAELDELKAKLKRVQDQLELQ